MQPRQQCDARPQPVCSRRIFLGSVLAASATVVAGALAGCQRPSTLKVVQPTTGGGRDDLSDSVIQSANPDATRKDDSYACVRHLR